MTTRLLVLLCIAGLPLAAVFAQSPTPTPTKAPFAGSPESRGVHEPKDENYVLTLSPAGKDGEGIAVIVTSSQTFNLSHNGFTFNGTLNQQDDGVFRLDYLLDTLVNGGMVHTGSSVNLRPGEPVQIIKQGEQFYNVRLDRYNAATPAKAGG